MIEVFKTNVEEICQAEVLVDLLLHHFPGSKVNFDLQDCDKILRVEGDSFVACQVMSLVEESGFACEILEW
jgi:hypothetical protein